jgi:hypothetical protein
VSRPTLLLALLVVVTVSAAVVLFGQRPPAKDRPATRDFFHLVGGLGLSPGRDELIETVPGGHIFQPPPLGRTKDEG